MHKVCLMALMLGVSGAAAADSMWQPQPYAGVQYGYLDYDRGNLKGQDLDVLSLRGGVQLNSLLSAEVRGGAGLFSQRYHGEKTRINFHYGLYVRLTLPNSSPFTPYLLGGYAYSDSQAAGRHQRDDGGSYGGGVSYALDSRVDLNLELLRLADNDHTRQNALTLGATYRF